jgi:CRISPR-associated endonuclease Cas1
MLSESVEYESPRALLHHIYTRNSTDEHVAIVHGFKTELRVQYGHLVIRDGIGRHRRERKYPKADRTLKLIIITSPDGYLTLEAMSWCKEHGTTVTALNLDCELVAHYATADRVIQPSLLRRQVLASDTDTALEIARELLTRKVNGQADLLLKLFNDSNAAAKLYHYAERMTVSDAITQRERDTASLAELEGWAGRDYFNAWIGNVAVPFSTRSLERIPSNWLVYIGRSSQIIGGGKKYNASDPVNAMLNYAYTLGYAQCRTACIAHRLNPSLGFIHSDKTGRDSLALDVLEAIRPEIDAYVLGLTGAGTQARKFTWQDFSEPYGYEPGTCRLIAPLTHEIAEASYRWRKSALDAAQVVANILTGHAGKRGSAMPNWQLHRDRFTRETVTVKEILPDKYWQTFTELLPKTEHKRGHIPIDNRVIIAAMIHCERHRRPWAHVPESLGVSYRTMRERRRQWQRSGHWPQIQAEIENICLLQS